MNGNVECWNFRLITQLRAIGVREITVTRDAAEALAGDLKGLHKPDAPIDFKPPLIGHVCGITFLLEKKRGSMSEEQILKEAFEYIAHCLEHDEVYLPHVDRFARGEEARKLIAEFARKRASGDNENWRKWCEVKAQQRQKYANAHPAAS